MIQTWQALWNSRKFWLLLVDVLIALIGLTVSTFFPTWADLVLKYVAIMQPLFVFIILAIAHEDAADKQAYYDAAIEYYKAEDECNEVDDEDWDLQEPVTA